jgi:4-hydroxy-3-polyprenylbenzoate decarboxylase
MGYKDLRDWIAALEAEGELKKIKAEVDWDLEISEIIRRVNKERGPAILFENIKDYGEGWCRKLFAGGLGNRARLALMFGLPKDAKYTEMIQLLRKRVKEPVEPVDVETGPAKENVISGEAVDLFQLPVPKWHQLDGGRYINTWAAIVTEDPETGRCNVGCYRGMIADKNKISVLLLLSQDWGRHYAKYQQRGKPMPVAVIYGWDPSMIFVAGSPFPLEEYKLMGSIRQQAVELVRCETSNLRVPASAEIVVEGTISPDPSTYRAEGPFGEITGYYGGWGGNRPVIDVQCMTYRNDPIYRGSLEGTSKGVVSEYGMFSYVAFSAVMWNILENLGVATGVLDLVPAPTTIVKIHKSFQGQPRQLAAALWGSKFGTNTAKIIVVVEEGVNIRNLREVELAIHANVDPVKDIIVFPMGAGSPLDTSLSPDAGDEIKYGTPLQDKVLIDATVDWTTHRKRPEWDGERLPPKCTRSSPEIVELVDKRWAEYGFEG